MHVSSAVKHPGIPRPTPELFWSITISEHTNQILEQAVWEKEFCFVSFVFPCEQCFIFIYNWTSSKMGCNELWSTNGWLVATDKETVKDTELEDPSSDLGSASDLLAGKFSSLFPLSRRWKRPVEKALR